MTRVVFHFVVAKTAVVYLYCTNWHLQTKRQTTLEIFYVQLRFLIPIVTSTSWLKLCQHNNKQQTTYMSFIYVQFWYPILNLTSTSWLKTWQWNNERRTCHFFLSDFGSWYQTWHLSHDSKCDDETANNVLVIYLLKKPKFYLG